MMPFLHLWRFNVPTFGLMLWLAAVTAAFVMDRNFRRARITADAVGMVAIAVLAGIVGAKLWHVIDTPIEFRELGWRVLWDSAGFAWFGGLVFGISALVFQGWWARIGGLRTLDLAAPAAAIGYGIGRIGCFLSGDGCYGLPTNLPWGMSFPHGIEPTLVPVHPTPLYELAAGLLIGGWLWWRGGKPRATGAIVGEYLLLSGIARFMVEFVRRNPKILWGLSNAQLASAGSVIAGITLIWWAATRTVTGPDEADIAMRTRRALNAVVTNPKIAHRFLSALESGEDPKSYGPLIAKMIQDSAQGGDTDTSRERQTEQQGTVNREHGTKGADIQH